MLIVDKTKIFRPGGTGNDEQIVILLFSLILVFAIYFCFISIRWLWYRAGY